MERLDVDASAGQLRESVRTAMESHWVPAGYTAPNSAVYPWLWLWDSCFHSLIWLELGDAERALSELRLALASQDESGFVPHMNFLLDPQASVEFWGRRGASSITQPPMYGHALAELSRRGVDVPSDLVASAVAGLRFLLESRARHRDGLLLLAHPWESGADDSPRWDSLCPGGYSPEAWYETKGHLVTTIERSATGAPLANPDFAVASAGFNALVAFNALELAELAGRTELAGPARELAAAVASRWDPDLETWLDAGASAGGSAAIRTVDSLLPTLVDPDRAASVGRLLLDSGAYGGTCGPTGVHRQESVFAPQSYWRGASWPQLNYLLSVAQVRAGNHEIASGLAQCLRTGAAASGLAEYWDPDDGTGLGAVPQSWAGVALLVDSEELGGNQ